MLKYPNDRKNGFVLLTHGNGEPYIPNMAISPEYERCSDVGNAMAYAGAFLFLSKQLKEKQSDRSLW